MIYDYIVVNKHDKAIRVEFSAFDVPHETRTIESGSVDTIYRFTIIEGTEIYERQIIFDSLGIDCDTIESKVDYLSNDSWEYKKKSRTHATYNLEVDNTHFE